MAHTADEQKALAHESRRVRSALDDLADLAGGKRHRAKAAPRAAAPPAPIPGLVPESFPLPPAASFAPPPAPAAAPGPSDWFGDDDAAAFIGTASSGEVDFNSAPDADVDTLGIRAANTQDTPAGGTQAPEPPGPQSEAINDVLDGFEW